jgi:hypothetical protein
MRESRDVLSRLLESIRVVSSPGGSAEVRKTIEITPTILHLAKVDVEGSNPFSRSAKFVGSPWYREAL